MILQLHPDHIELGYSLMLGPTSSENARREADVDQSRKLDESEKASIGARWRALAQEAVSLRIDGVEEPLQFEPARVSLDGVEVNGALVSIAMKAVVDTGSSGDHVLQITDSVPIARGGDLDVQVLTKGTARVLESGSGDGTAWSLHRHAADADLRSPVTVRIHGGGRDHWWSRLASPLTLAALTLVVLTAIAAFARVRARPRT